METPWQWTACLLTLLLILGLESAAPLPVLSPTSDPSISNCPLCRILYTEPRKENESMWVFEVPKDPTWYMATDIHTGDWIYCLLVYRIANWCNFGLQYHTCNDDGEIKNLETSVNCKGLHKIEVLFNNNKIEVRGLHTGIIFQFIKTLAPFYEIQLNRSPLIILDEANCHFSKNLVFQNGREYYIKLIFGTSSNIHFKPEIPDASFRLPDHQWQSVAAELAGNETLFVYSNKESAVRMKSTLPSLTMKFDDDVLWCTGKYLEELSSTSKASSYSLTTRTSSPTTEASSPKGSHATETYPITATTDKVLSDSRTTPLVVSPSPNQSLADVCDTGTTDSAREMQGEKNNSEKWIPFAVLALLVPCFLYLYKTQMLMAFFTWLKGITVRCFKLMPSREHQYQDTRERGSGDSSIFEIIAVYDTEELTSVAQGSLGSDARLSGSLQDKELHNSSLQDTRIEVNSRASSQHGIDLKTDKDASVLPSDEDPKEAPVTLQSDVGINDLQKEDDNPRNPSIGNHDIQTTKLESEDDFERKNSPNTSPSDKHGIHSLSHAKDGSQTSLHHEIDLNISLDYENELHTWLYRESGKQISAMDSESHISQAGSGSQNSVQD